jgi:hypothetical protein
MNKAYTCHQCGKVFDLFPGLQAGAPLGIPQPTKVQVKCPGCYDAGYTGYPGSQNPVGKGNMRYTLDLSTDPPTVL